MQLSRSQRNFPSPPTNGYGSNLPRHPSRMNISRNSIEFFSAPLPPSQAFPLQPIQSSQPVQSIPKQSTSDSSLKELPRHPSFPPPPELAIINPSSTEDLNTSSQSNIQLTTSQTIANQPAAQATVVQPTTTQPITTQPNTNQLEVNQSNPDINEKAKERERDKEPLTAANLSKILTNKTDDITPQERISQIIQTLLGIL